MKKIFLVALSVVFMGTSCSWQDPNLSVAAQNNTETTNNAKNPRKEISFENVSFYYDENWVAEVKSEIIPASPLKNKDDKPDNVRSENISFQITYLNTKKEPAAISVFKIEEYKKAFTIGPAYVEAMEKEIANLRKILKKNPSKIKPSGFEQLPYIPYLDGHQGFNAKAKVIEFQNGRGLGFLMQYSQEAVSFVNNEDLYYIFQGFTSDERFFIFAEFPVSAESLPEKVGDDDYPTIDRYVKNQKEYERYINGTAKKLDALSNDKFAPNLSKIEEILSSLKIR